MAESRMPGTAAKPIRAPRGVALSCKGWQQEAALRLLTNCLDPAIAERPEELIVSSSIGKLARDWPALDAMVKSIESVADDETLLIQSGAVDSILKTNSNAPRVLVINSAAGRAANQPAAEAVQKEGSWPASTRFAADWNFTGPVSTLPEAYEIFRAAARKHLGGTLAGRLVVSGGMGGIGGALPVAATLNGAAFLGIDADAARVKRYVKTGFCEVMVHSLDEALRILKNAVRKRAPASVGLNANPVEVIPELAHRGILPDLLTDLSDADQPYIPAGLTREQAAEWSEKDPRAYVKEVIDSIASVGRAMVDLKSLGATILFELGDEMRAEAFARGFADAYEVPIFTPEYMPQSTAIRSRLTVVALSGEPNDLARIDALFGELFPDTDLQNWVAMTRRHRSPALPARSCRIGAEDAIRLGNAINELVFEGQLAAPVAVGRSIRLNGSAAGSQLSAAAPNSASSAQSLADSSQLDALLRAASGAAWLGVERNEDSSGGFVQSIHIAIVADGKAAATEAIARLLAKDLSGPFPVLPL